MDKIKDMLHGGHKKEGAEESVPATTAGFGQPGMVQPTGTEPQGHPEKKGLFGLGGGHKKEGHGSSSSSSSSDEEREGARERNRLRREKRAQKKAGATTGTTTVPLQGGEKKHGFFG